MDGEPRRNERGRDDRDRPRGDRRPRPMIAREAVQVEIGSGDFGGSGG